MPLSRRDLLRLAAAASVVPTLAPLAGCDDEAEGPKLPRYEWSGEPGPADLFSHGVASGDPLPDAVILWTRVSPASAEPVEVFFEVATDAEFKDRIVAEWTETSLDRDFTVKVDPQGLTPGTRYFYRFFAQGRTSPVGRTRTAPAGATDQLAFGICSCAALGQGELHAYAGLAAAELDAVLHLGDYMYEYGNDGGFGGSGDYDPPHETVTLEDYRRRYAWYRLKPQLQAIHAAHPMICVWDDHESANDSWMDGAQNHDPETEGDWPTRRAASARAWREWLPVRVQSDPERIWRHFRYGDLVDLVMLDTRLWGRDEKVFRPEDRFDPERQLLGADQEDWLAATLGASTTRWRIIGQQVMVAPLELSGIPVNNDQWDGYPEARGRFLELLKTAGDCLVVTGDIHSSWASELPAEGAAYDPETSAGAVAAEFVTPAISSRALPFLTDRVARLIGDNNPHIRFFELTQRGFIRVTVTPERIQGDWYLYPDIRPETVPPPTHAAAWQLRPGSPRLVPVDGPAD